MTGVSLGARPADNPDELALFADGWTVLNKPVADRFREACRADADAHDGWVNPNRVREHFLVDGELAVDPRQYSALWSKACARDGYLVVTDVKVPIKGPGSKGNGNKDIRLRRFADDPEPVEETP